MGEVWNPPYRYDLISEFAAEDFVIHTSGDEIKGPADFRAWVEGFHAKLPEVRFEIEDLFVDGETVTTRWSCRGKDAGIFGSEGSGEPVKFRGITITKVQDGKMVEKWVERSVFEKP